MINYLRFVGNNWRSKVYDILFVIFIFSISTFQRISAAVLVLLVVVAPFTAVRKEFWRGVQASWDLLAYFAVLSIGLLYTTDLLQGIKVLETSLSLLAVSFVVGFFSKHIDLESGIFYPFVAGLWVSGLICLFNAFRSYCTGEGVEVFFFEHFTSAIDAQPTYFAYYLIFGITAGLYILHFENPKSRVVIIVTLVFLLCILLLTGGQTTFISLQMILAFFILRFSLAEVTGTSTLLFFLVLAMMVCVFLYSLQIRTRPEFGSLRDQNDYWERGVLWESALKANREILLGVGTGDYNLVLNEFYRDHDLQSFAERNTNAHNQYLQSLIMNGVLGVLTLLITLIRPLYLYARRGSTLGILVIFPFVVYGVTEVFLGRYQGVVLFAVLHQWVISRYFEEKNGLFTG